MTKLQTDIKEFMLKAGQTVREKPSMLTVEERILRVKLIFEEAFEFAEALGVKIISDEEAYYISDNNITLESVGDAYIIEAADAIADLNYVVNGAAVAMGIDMEPIDKEVHRSNMSKFIDGFRREDGKWVKGPSYTPANIKPIIEAQLKST